MAKSLLLWAALASLPLAAEPVAHHLPQGTPLVLSTLEQLTPGETADGQITFRVERDVLAPDGTPVIARGSEAVARVTRSETASPFGHQNALEIQLESVPAVDGHSVPLRATRARGDAFSRTLQTAGPGPLARLSSFGMPAEFKTEPGTLFSAFTHQDVAVLAEPTRPLQTPRKLQITSPEPNAEQLQNQPLQVHYQLTPADPDAVYRIYLDGLLVSTRQGDAAPLPWNLQSQPRTTQPTFHTLQVEATDSAGRLTVSPVSHFQLRHANASQP